MNYEVKSQQFSGPLDKLLGLIEAKQLEITQISLADVTADFLNYIKSLQALIEPRILADFLVVAAKLVLIKSKILLPSLELTEEEREDVVDLETRLKLYREYKLASEGIKKLWDSKRRAFSRPLFMSLGDRAIFYPPAGLTARYLADSLRKLAETVREFLPKATKKIKETVITLEGKIKDLLLRFQTAAEHSFREISRAGTRQEAIVFFLAVLHLLKDRLIKVEQEGQFEDIILKKL